MAKSTYAAMCEELASKIQGPAESGGRKSCSYSRSDLEGLALGLLNCPEHTVTEYQMRSVDSDGKPITIEKQPSKRYRDSLKPVLRDLGLDRPEAERIADIKFNKEHAAALMGVATEVIKCYMKAGRKFQFPITAPDEVRMEMSIDYAPERINQNRFAKTDEERAKVTKTARRAVLKAKNSAVPPWLKSTEKE